MKLVLLAIALVAGDARAVIDGPSQVATGDLVVLKAGQSVASDTVWTLIPANKTFLPVDTPDGPAVVFSSGSPGTWTFVLSVAHESDVAVATHVVTIGDETLPPDDPDIPPPPPPSPGFESLKQSVTANLETVSAEVRYRTQKAVAAAYAKASAAIADDMDREQAKDVLELPLQRSDLAEWYSWRRAIGQTLGELDAAGQFDEPAEWSAGYLAISQALEGN